MTKSLIISIILLAVSGCSSVSGILENRVSCAVAKDKAFFVSEYGPLGIAATISDKDSAVICK